MGPGGEDVPLKDTPTVTHTATQTHTQPCTLTDTGCPILGVICTPWPPSTLSQVQVTRTQSPLPQSQCATCGGTPPPQRPGPTHRRDVPYTAMQTATHTDTKPRPPAPRGEATLEKAREGLAVSRPGWEPEEGRMTSRLQWALLWAW